MGSFGSLPNAMRREISRTTIGGTWTDRDRR